MSALAPDYLQPYLDAVQRHGDGFKSLLWDSQKSQAARFDALVRLCKFEGHSILDVGCGRADLLDYLVGHDIHPEHYTGLEGVDTLAAAARCKGHDNCLIVVADFVNEPARLFTGADVIVFCGSLNTVEDRAFYATLRAAHTAAVKEVAFNFLCSPRLAGAKYLHWRPRKTVKRFLKELGGKVAMVDNYIDGDCTARVRKN